MFKKYDDNSEQILIEGVDHKREKYRSSILVEHKFIFHIPPQTDIWRYKNWILDDTK